MVNWGKNINGIVKIMLISFLWCLFSCGKEKKAEYKVGTTYFFEKVDSIRIDLENTVRILDFNPVTHRFLAFDKVTQEFLVLNSRGQILESIFRKGQGPNEYNSSLIAASFNHEEGGYFAISSTEFIWFNKNWEVNKRIRFASHVIITSYGGPKTKVPYFRRLQGDPPYFFTSFFSGVNTSGGKGDGILSDYLIEMYDPQKQSLNWVLNNDSQQLPEYELDKESGQTKPVQVFDLDKEANLLYLSFERSNEIGVYDLSNDYKLIKKMSINHRKFSANQKSKNKLLFHFPSNFTCVFYFEGISETATESRKSNNPDYFPFQDPTLYKFIVLKDGLQQHEIEFPLNCEPHSEMVTLPNNRIIMRDRYLGDDEPRYSTYSVFELRKSGRSHSIK